MPAIPMMPPVVRPRARLAALALLAHAALPAAARAQALGPITGTVADAATNAAIVDAKVSVRGRPVPVPTDSAGHFVMTGVAPGTLVLQVRAVGFTAATRIVEVTAGDTASVDVALVHATTLNEVVVQDKKPLPSKRFDEFAQRRKSGRGSYWDRDDIEKSHAPTVIDLIKNARGVQPECSGTSCLVKMVSAPPGCFPEFWVDGRPNNSFGPTMPIGDIEAVEVYNGPAQTPAEFQGGGGCGTIVIWTKSTP